MEPPLLDTMKVDLKNSIGVRLNLGGMFRLQSAKNGFLISLDSGLKECNGRADRCAVTLPAYPGPADVIRTVHAKIVSLYLAPASQMNMLTYCTPHPINPGKQSTRCDVHSA